MNILFVHQSFPGQYVHLAPALAQRGHKVTALCIQKKGDPPGVQIIEYGLTRGNTPNIHPWVAEIETKVLRGEAAGRAALLLKNQGYVPDLICAHPGWGESLFLKDIWPQTKLLCFFEFYYHFVGADVNFDPEFATPGAEAAAKIRLKNTNNLLALDAADWGVSPTAWQHVQFPSWARDKISIIHDGIDTDIVAPDPAARIQLAEAGVELVPGDEVVTFVNRDLEPYRGYHRFMRALPRILQTRPKARVVIVGGDGISYGAAPPNGKTWKQVFLDEVGAQLDLSHVHFVGRIPYPAYLKLLQVSAAHVYLTFPFVLSWSLLEALSAGCAVIGSRTAPVEEAIRHGDNGLLVDFFDASELAETVIEVLAEPEKYRAMRARARADVIEKYDLKTVCLPRHIALAEALAQGQPAPGAV
ncbi:MAG TPA: glycosyltransferase family 4 protein [Burkholderiaceae bacterium]